MIDRIGRLVAVARAPGCVGPDKTGVEHDSIYASVAQPSKDRVGEWLYRVQLRRRLLEHLEQLTRARGPRLTHLKTSEVLPEAIGIYRTSGYQDVSPFNDEPSADRWFAKQLRVGGGS